MSPDRDKLIKESKHLIDFNKYPQLNLLVTQNTWLLDEAFFLEKFIDVAKNYSLSYLDQLIKIPLIQTKIKQDKIWQQQISTAIHAKQNNDKTDELLKLFAQHGIVIEKPSTPLPVNQLANYLPETIKPKSQADIVKDLYKNFNKHIKFIADRTYLQKMGEQQFENLLHVPNEQLPKPQTNNQPIRKFHGVLHAARVTGYIAILHEFRKKSLKQDGTIDPFTEQAMDYLCKQFKMHTSYILILTKLSAFFHDSARQKDGPDKWDEPSAENCYKFMLHQGIDDKIAKFFANAARYKDDPDKFKLFCQSIFNNPTETELKQCDYIRHLINAADTLDVMRVRSVFDESYLKDFCKVDEHPKNRENANTLMQDIRRLIAQQNDLSKGSCRIKLQSGSFLPDEDFPISVGDTVNIQFDTSADPYKLVQQRIEESSAYLQELSSTATDVASQLMTLEAKKKQEDLKKFYQQHTKSRIPTDEEEQQIYKKVYKEYNNAQLGKIISMGWSNFAPSIFKEEFDKQDFSYQLDTLRQVKSDPKKKPLKARLGQMVPSFDAPHLPKEITSNMSKKTSTSIFSALSGAPISNHSKLFKFDFESSKRGENGEMVGVMFFSDDPMNDYNFKISLISHNARGVTRKRGYHFTDKKEGTKYSEDFGNWRTVEDVLRSSPNPAATNELLARLKFSVDDPRSQVLIGLDNLRSKIVAQLRMIDIKNIANVSFVPASFYLPNYTPAIRPYFSKEQKLDLNMALENNNVAKDIKAMAVMISWFNNNTNATELDNLIKNFNIKKEFLSLLFDSNTSNITKMKFLEKFLEINFSQLDKEQKLILIEKIKKQLEKNYTQTLELKNLIEDALKLAAESMIPDLSNKLFGTDSVVTQKTMVPINKDSSEIRKKYSNDLAALAKDLDYNRTDGVIEHSVPPMKPAVTKEAEILLTDYLDHNPTDGEIKHGMPSITSAVAKNKETTYEEQFITAIKQKKFGLANNLLDDHRKEIVNYTLPDGNTVVHLVVRIDKDPQNTAILRKLLEYGALFDEQHPTSLVTPLHIAISYGEFERAELLLDKGADINKKNIHNKTSLQQIEDKITFEKDKFKIEKYQDLKLKIEAIAEKVRPSTAHKKH